MNTWVIMFANIGNNTGLFAGCSRKGLEAVLREVKVNYMEVL